MAPRTPWTRRKRLFEQNADGSQDAKKRRKQISIGEISSTRITETESSSVPDAAIMQSTTVMARRQRYDNRQGAKTGMKQVFVGESSTASVTEMQERVSPKTRKSRVQPTRLTHTFAQAMTQNNQCTENNEALQHVKKKRNGRIVMQNRKDQRLYSSGQASYQKSRQGSFYSVSIIVLRDE